MKIARLTKYGNLAASTRQRFQQYSPWLKSAGFEMEDHPLLDNQYLSTLYTERRRDPAKLLKRYLERAAWLFSKPEIDLIWLHCELFPYLPSLAERLAQIPKKPIVYDYDDAIFHNYDMHSNPIVRGALRWKLRPTISAAEMSFCGNRYLFNYAGLFCQRVEIVPTVVDITAYSVAAPRDGEAPRRIGWIGTPSTWTEYMAPIMPVLSGVAANHGARIMAVGAGQAKPDPMLDVTAWSEDTEVANIQKMDIGIMPLADTPWSRGKCGYKLIQYMACGLPVVASPVGVNAEIVEHGVNGFLASTHAEWQEALSTLLRDPDLRHRMGTAGRRKIEQHYSLQVWGPRVASLLKDVTENRKSV
jgi:glycosyltransferase involved in cell wall biosynthesis